MLNRERLIGVFVAVALFCPLNSLGRIALGETIMLRGVPHVQQKPDFCGEACAEMWLRKLGSPLDQDAVFDHASLDPLLARGCWTRDLNKSLRALGFETGRVWHRVQPRTADAQMNAMLDSIRADLKQGLPTIVCMQYDDQPNATEHFRLIVGWDETTDEIAYHEPAVDRAAYRRMKRDRFFKLWPLKYKPDEWTVVSIRLANRAAARVPQTSGFTSADYCQHVMQLKGKLPNPSFNIVLQHPFVVVGDEPLEVVKRRAKNTVGWAVEKVKAQYFSDDPQHIIDVWLFKDRTSYEQNVVRLFNSKPSTPFGYYSPSDRSLVMNISTGGGTLVHELVHPFMESNFPNCPSWFNEGLASLYEQSASKEGKIVGLTNWRLAGLQEALRSNSVPPFKELCGTSTREFYDRDPGTNYSQARYLCYYLQQKGLLRKFYHAFHNGATDDPTGYQTLQNVLGSPNMDAWRKDWELFVMGLRFP